MRIIAFFTAFISIQCFAQTSAAIDEYINNYQKLAIEEQLRTGIPAAITLAQGIHESGAGAGELALRSNNHFGIKCKSTWTGKTVYHDDDETGECFRAYNCVADSYKDHSDFLRTGKRYGFLFELKPEDYSGWARGLKQAGYATNPKYPQIIIRIIEENSLQELTLAALGQKTPDSGDVWVQASTLSTETTQAAEKDPVVANEPKVVAAAKTKPPAPAPAKQGIFKINRCKVVFAESGTSLRILASQQGLSIKELLAYNDMRGKEKTEGNQLIFLEEKKKKGANKTHEVQRNETVWGISQQEGIQLESLLAYNGLKATSKLKAGQLLYLRKKAPK